MPRSRRARRNNRSEIGRHHASGFSRSLRAKQSKRAGGTSRNAESPDLRVCQRRTRQTRGGACRHTQTHAWEPNRSEEHTSELQSLMRISYAVFCLTKKKPYTQHEPHSAIPPVKHIS